MLDDGDSTDEKSVSLAQNDGSDIITEPKPVPLKQKDYGDRVRE